MKVAERVMSPSNASAIRSYISRKCTCLLSGRPNGTSPLGLLHRVLHRDADAALELADVLHVGVEARPVAVAEIPS